MLDHTSKSTGGPHRMLSVQEAAGELGISRSLTYELLSSGALRSVKIGRRRLVPREAIEAYIASLPPTVRASEVSRRPESDDVESGAVGPRQAGLADTSGVSPRTVLR